MKNSLFVIVALLAGLVLGNWSGQSDLRRARKEIAGLKEQLSHRAPSSGDLRGITSLLRIPDPVRTRETPAATVDTNALPSTAEATNEEATTDAPTPEPKAESRESMQQQIKTAVDLWKTRSALARDSFLSNIDASPVQTQMFDDAIAKMNQQLGDKIRQWADFVKQEQQLTPETGVRMMNDLSTPLVAAYNELDRVLTPDWRANAGPQFQVFDFINPEVALPMTEVEGLMNKRGFQPQP